MKKGVLLFIACIFLVPFGFASLQDGLVGYWPFDENTLDLDSTIGTYDLTYDSSNYVLGKLGNAISFSGLSGTQYYPRRTGDDSIFDVGISESMTICAWVKSSVSEDTAFISKQDTAYPYRGWLFGQLRSTECGNTVNAIYFDFINSYPTRRLVRATVPINTGTWQHICAVVDRGEGQITVYQQGVDVTYGAGSSYCSRSLTGYGAVDAATGLIVGARNSASPTARLNGQVDEVSIWNRALSSSEISQLYNGGNGYSLIQPSINVISPVQDTYYNTSNIAINFTATNAEFIWYNNGTANSTAINVSQTPYFVDYFNASDGKHNFTFYANNSYGKLSEENVTFTIDTTIPSIEFVNDIEGILGTPLNNSNFSRNWIFINFSLIEANLDIYEFFLYDSNLTLLNSLDDNSEDMWYNFTDLSDGQYFFDVEVCDLAGNCNQTELRTIKLDTTHPTVSLHNYAPTDNASIDPGVNISITANVTDILSNVNTVLLVIHNGTHMVNYSMNNLTENLYYYNFTTGNIDQTYTFYVWANDSLNNYATSENTTVYSYWDCTWNMSLNSGSNLGDFFGFDQNINFANITIFNTGDSNFTDSCPLYFFLQGSLPSSTFRFDNQANVKTYGPLYANQSQDVTLYFRFRNEIFQDYLNISITESSSIADPYHQDVLDAQLISTSGPYLYQSVKDILTSGTNNLLTKRNASFYEIFLSPQNLFFNATLRNGVGDGSAEFTAYNVSFNWFFNGLFNFSYTSDSSNVTQNNGSLFFYYENISDGALGEEHFSELSLNLTQYLNNLSYDEIYEINVTSYGFNESGAEIVHANDIIINKHNIFLQFSCYGPSDGVCVSGCGAYDLGINATQEFDRDCPYCGNGVVDEGETCSSCPQDAGVCPQQTSSGGGGVSSGASGGFSLAPEKVQKLFQTEAFYELVRGREDSFTLIVENDFEGALENVLVSITGFLNQYLDVQPNVSVRIPLNSSKNYTIFIAAPEYFTDGEYLLNVSITGVINKSRLLENNLTAYKYEYINETRSVTLLVTSVSKDEATELISKAHVLLRLMKEDEMSVRHLEKQLSEMIFLAENRNYLGVKSIFEEIQESYQLALNTIEYLDQINAGISEAEYNGLTTTETRRLTLLTKAAFERGDFATANLRAKDAQLTLALETVGKINLVVFAKQHWKQILVTLIVISLFGYLLYLIFKYLYMKQKIQSLKNEQNILLGLVKEIQIECFKYNKISIEQYYESLVHYDKKIAEVVKKILELTSKKKFLFNIFASNILILTHERGTLIEKMKKTQDNYINSQEIETRLYESRMHTYAERLAEIEERLVNLEVAKTLKYELQTT